MSGAGRRVAVMQPYLFPYVPYVQLMAAVDVFVILDTVQFIADGWAHRNRLADGEAAQLFTIPIAKAPLATSFAERRLGAPADRAAASLERTIAQRYARAPHRDEALDCLRATLPALVAGTPFVDAFERMADWLERALGRALPRVRASSIDVPTGDSAQDRVIALVSAVGGTAYLNAIGGRSLYDPAVFAARGIDLAFLDSGWTARSGGGLSLLHALAIEGRAGVAAGLDDWRAVR